MYWVQQGCETDCPAPEIQILVEVKENSYALLSIQGSVVSTRMGLLRLHPTSARAAVYRVATSLSRYCGTVYLATREQKSTKISQRQIFI